MAYSDLILTNNPSYYFRFENGTVTNSGSATTVLTIGGDNTYTSGGVVGNKLHTSGDLSTSYGFETSDTTVIFNDKVFTVEAWVKIASIDNIRGYNLFDGTYGSLVFNTPGVRLGFYKDGSNLGLYSSVNGDVTYGLSSFAYNTWHHIAVVADGSTQKLYFNGSQVGSASISGTLTSDSAVKYFARVRPISGGTMAGFIGDVDELAVYTSALTANEIQSRVDLIRGASVTATALTASGLLSDPAISVIRNINYTATVATASGLFPDPAFSTLNFPTMLDTYLAGRSFEQWYKFDEIGKINNYGSGGDVPSSWAFNGESINLPQAGIQGSGALKLKGEEGNTVQLAFGIDTPINPELTDNEFSVGFWFKAESGFGAKNFGIFQVGQLFSGNSYEIRATANGYIEFRMVNNNGTHVASSLSNNTTNWCDGNWHLIQARASDSANRLKLTIDNGTEVSTTTNGQFPNAATITFGTTASSGTNSKYGYVSNLFITGYNSITSTERAAMITAAAVPIQGTAKIIPAIAKFTNQYQEKIDTYSPKIAFRLNEASGAPTNYGTINGTLSIAKNGTNITYLQPTQNTYAYKFTNADTYIQGDYAFTSGTFSSGNHQTMAAVFKSESTVNFEQIIGSMGMYGFIGSGISLTIGGTNGYLEARINQGFGPTDTDSLTTTINVCDNKYHHVVGVRDGSIFKLYLDGKQVASTSSAVTNLSDAAAYGISAEAKYNFGQGAASKALYIDEFAVMSTALSALQVFELYQLLNIDGAMTGSGLFVNPAYTAGYGPQINPGVAYASGLLPNPTQQDTINILPTPMVAYPMFANPNYAATKNFNYLATPMTGNASGQDPVASAGGRVGALHMDASAIFPSAYSRIPGVWNASPMVGTANAVQPGFVTTKGALIKPQSLNATAQFPLPPAYYLVTDDKWYQRLLNVDYQSANYGGIITFFNTNSNIYLNGSYGGWTAQSNRNAFNSYYGYNMNDTPLPVATAGGFDPIFRKTLNLRNIALAYQDAETYSQDWTFETMIKTTKSNQIITSGYYLGDTSSSTSRSYRTGFRLKDGKFALIPSKDTTSGFLNSTDDVAFTGFKNVADGEWHHVIIQYRQSGDDITSPRLQIFIDGKLDIQRYGYRAYVPNQIGFNSSDINAYSDFEISAVAVNKASFVLEREININYLAAFGITPIEAGPMLASAELTQKNKARGNRGRALMLYFWDTFNATTNSYKPYYAGGPAGTLGTSTTLNDQGAVGDDPDSFYQLNTWINNAPNKFYDWDIWPCPVVRFPSGETWKGDSHPILKDGITKSGTKNGTVYIDPVTDDYRYLDLMNDLKDLDQFDMICFRNYPDNSSERDGYGTTAKGIADPYFNTLDKDLFQNFLTSLREAIDTGISLFITNPQLAIDLGFIEGYAQVPDLAQSDDNIHSPKIATDPLNTGLFSPLNYVNSTTDPNRGNAWTDMAKNNRHKVVTEIENLTTDPAYVWDKLLQYTADGLEYGETGRVFHHIEYKPKLSVGDTFMTSDFRTSQSTYFAVPFDKVKAGKIVTSFAETLLQGTTETVNPYRNYATTIAVEPGTVVAGKQIGAKVFISFTDGVGVQQGSGGYEPFENIGPIDGALIELKTDAWINYAYSIGNITDADRDEYIANPNNLDRQLAAGTITQAQYNAKTYWQLDGQNLLGQANAYGNSNLNLVDTADGVTKGKVSGRTRAGRRNTITSTSSLPAYTIQWSYLYPTAIVETPTINTRGLWWLSERLAYEELPQRPVALEGSAFMPNPTVTGYKVASINVQSMVASGKINEVTVNNVSAKSPNITNPALPMTAQAKLVGLGLNVAAGVATASARITTSYIYTTDLDQVVVYIMHEDPILYIREDVIK